VERHIRIRQRPCKEEEEKRVRTSGRQGAVAAMTPLVYDEPIGNMCSLIWASLRTNAQVRFARLDRKWERNYLLLCQNDHNAIFLNKSAFLFRTVRCHNLGESVRWLSWSNELETTLKTLVYSCAFCHQEERSNIGARHRALPLTAITVAEREVICWATQA